VKAPYIFQNGKNNIHIDIIRIKGMVDNIMAVDPVCGMKVDESKTKYVSEFEGKKYYFCCGHCKEEFDKNPHKYLHSGQHHCH
jgi:YHS domain-containing protein